MMTDEHLMKYILGEAKNDEREKIEEWLKASEINQKHFLEIQFLWEQSKNLLQNNPQPDEELAWEKFKSKRDLQKVKKMEPRSIFQLIAAASVVFITAISLWIFFSNSPGNNTILSKNEIVSNKLSDGSLVTINKNSNISFNVTDIERTVKLQEGEAFFKIIKDKTKPFVVEVGDFASITVLGTSFNVKYRAGIAEVIVETGLVKVSKNNTEVFLHPGEKIEFSSSDSILQPLKNSDSLYKYFRNNEFVIDNVSLKRVVSVLSEAYSTKIIIADNELENLKLNVKFKDESLDKILEVISATFQLKLIKEKDGYILQKK